MARPTILYAGLILILITNVLLPTMVYFWGRENVELKGIDIIECTFKLPDFDVIAKILSLTWADTSSVRQCTASRWLPAIDTTRYSYLAVMYRVS